MHRHHSQAGLTLVEMSIAMVVTAVLAVAIIHSLKTLTSTHGFVEDKLRVQSVGERVIQQVRDDVRYSVRLFTNDSEGTEYLSRLELGADERLPGSRLAVPSTIGYFEVDAPGTVLTGNMLFFVRNVDHREVSITTPMAASYRINLLRFVCYFLAEDRDGNLDLHRWASKPLARLSDLQAIPDSGARSAVMTALRGDGIDLAWDPSHSSVGGACIQLASGTALAPWSASNVLAGDPRQCIAGLLGPRHLRACRNGTVGSGPIPMWAKPTAGFPHGFEVKMDGGGRGILVGLRLAVETITSGRRANAIASTEIGIREE